MGAKYASTISGLEDSIKYNYYMLAITVSIHHSYTVVLYQRINREPLKLPLINDQTFSIHQ